MQKFIFSFALLASLLFASPELLAQKTKKIIETQFHVDGVCDMCKERIETAALDLKGVKWVNWDKETKIITVKYKPKKIDPEVIHIAIAEVGHNTSKVTANEDDYQDLPTCCQYLTEKTH